MLAHPIPPTYDENSEILILGSFPSVKSRETGYFYGHPQNRFWKVVAALYDEQTPATVPERRDFLLRNHVAVWDVIASCEIRGSSDTSIKNVTANDLSFILDKARIRA
ncbi:MAG: DNA-deoxyinosine glycosylase, partial [Lachnospiraceae bacterium]|nr:DNA-deoxyinosine glycosylase [Lachnospiraceae bacterium]